MNIEDQIRKEFDRMNHPLAVKSTNYSYGNTAETWEGLSQYGFPMFYAETKEQAEAYVIEFYKNNFWLIEQ